MSRKKCNPSYLSSGSSEWSNFPRAIIAITPKQNTDEFSMELGKRGNKAGWRDKDGNPTREKVIRHAKDTIFGKEVPGGEPEGLPQPRRTGRKCPLETIWAFLPADGSPVSKNVLEMQASENGVAIRRFSP